MKFDIFLKGNIVNLVRVTKSIVLKTNFYTWLNDQRITKYTKQGYFPVSKKDEIEYYEQQIKSKKRLQLGVVKKKINSLIGIMSLYNIDHYDRSCHITALFNVNDKNISTNVYHCNSS